MDKNRLPTKLENPKGLHQKYYIQKIKPSISGNFYRSVDKNAEYFVLRLDDGGRDPKHIEACRKAVLKYAEEIADHIPQLSKDLIERYGR